MPLYPSGLNSSGAILLGFSQVTANQASITVEVDLTGLSVTVTVPSDRRIRITGETNFVSSVANDYVELKIQQDGVQVQAGGVTIDTANISMKLPISVVLTPSAGTHVYKLRAVRGAGTGNVQLVAGATFPAHILVEDITGGPDPINPDTAWTAYTPTLVQSGAVTKTVNSARYMRSGRTITAQVGLTCTGAGTAANAVQVGLPVPAASTNSFPIGTFYLAVTASPFNWVGIAIPTNVNYVQGLVNQNTGFLGATGGGFAGALAATNFVGIEVTYEAAS